MADSTDEIIPSGWEKRVSRSTSTYSIEFEMQNNQYAFYANRCQLYLCFVYIFFLVWLLLLLGELRRLEMPYYLNVYTKESQWELPTEAAEEGVSNGPSQVQAAHLLVKHKDSRRPSSWREDNITRTRDEAHEILSGYLEKVSVFISSYFSF